MENNEKNERIKASKRKYGDVYNKVNRSVQLNRELLEKLQDKLGDTITLKKYLEELIKKDINEIQIN